MSSYAPHNQIDAPRPEHANRSAAGALVFAALPGAAFAAAAAPMVALTVALCLVGAVALYRSAVAR